MQSIPLLLNDLSISTTISTACSISNLQFSPLSSHTGLTSMLMLCQFASKSLWPSSSVEIPTFALHGRSLRKGVRFSVQTGSRGNDPWRRCSRDSVASEWWPVGWKLKTGLIVRVASMKLSEAQNKPERAFVSVVHRANALPAPPPPPPKVSIILPIALRKKPHNSLLFIPCLYPRPNLHPRSPRSPSRVWLDSVLLCIPPPKSELHMQLPCPAGS